MQIEGLRKKNDKTNVSKSETPEIIQMVRAYLKDQDVIIEHIILGENRIDIRLSNGELSE